GLGLVSLFAKACVRALKEFPLVNSTFTGEDIIYRDFVDLSVAVSTESGLVVPVIRDADKISVVEFEKKLDELGKRAKEKKLSIAEMTGGTFTISNGGVFGSMLSTPILNMPQSGILGLHKTQDRAVVVDGQIVIRPMMYVALSYDHRIIDGREAVSFLVKVKEGIEKLDLILNEKDLSL
ncbi:MAG: 2-oxo acid dehydrogenase subunit E2, partial [Deltaproteobacteria bacterium]|nr:2-oxo acid dehydrogenase subunit E2 [Deltaproteobacteria bacterium]